MSDRLRVGVVGCGNVSTTYFSLAPLFRSIEIIACADTNESAATARASEYSLLACNVDGLLERDDIDIIVNLTIPAAHAAVSRRALEAGKHVYSEKPFVLSVSEGQSLLDLADARGLRVGSAPDTFLGGTHQHARKLIDDGTIGRVTSATAHVMSHGMEHWHPNPGFFYQPGAGPILDIGPYYITNLIQLLGPVQRVQAAAITPRDHRLVTTEDRLVDRVEVATPTTVHALLEFEVGALVSLGASWDVRHHNMPCMELHGEHGSLALPDPNFFGGSLQVWHSKDELVALTPFDHPFSVANQDLDQPQPRANYRTAGLADMASAILEKRLHRCSGLLALHAIEVMTSILESAQDHRVVDISSRCERPEPLSPEAARLLMT